MKPRLFDYVRPDTVDEALAVLDAYGDEARILAGGQSLIPMLNLRLIDASVLIDISRLAELDAIRDLGQSVEVCAAVTQNTLMAWPQLKEKLPLVATTLPFVGHFQTRNKGTVCGSIAHADPSSELPLVLAALGGEVVLRSRKRGERVLPASDFQQDMLTTARAGDEVITAVRFPVRAGQGVGFREVARRHGDFAIVAVAAVVENDTVRLAVGGMLGRPLVRNLAANSSDGVVEAAWDWASELEGYDDLHASAAMRRDLFRNLAPHVLAEAMKSVSRGAH